MNKNSNVISRTLVEKFELSKDPIHIIVIIWINVKDVVLRSAFDHSNKYIGARLRSMWERSECPYFASRKKASFSEIAYRDLPRLMVLCVRNPNTT